MFLFFLAIQVLKVGRDGSLTPPPITPHEKFIARQLCYDRFGEQTRRAQPDKLKACLDHIRIDGDLR